MKPVVFLDFDGVVMTQATYTEAHDRLTRRPRGASPVSDRDIAVVRMDPALVANVSTLCLTVEADIVLSTSWRGCGTEDDPAIQALRLRGLDARVPAVGATPHHPSRYRGREIVDWLRWHRPRWTPTDVLVLDDDGDLEPLLDRWVKTTFQEGFGPKELAEALALFGRTS